MRLVYCGRKNIKLRKSFYHNFICLCYVLCSSTVSLGLGFEKLEKDKPSNSMALFEIYFIH